MNGNSHCLVALLALSLLEPKERDVLLPHWACIEGGATLSDHFKIMWEPVVAGGASALVHRCYVDSNNPKDHGCITRALDHAEGSICFVEDYLSGEMDDVYTEVEFLANLAMYLGILSHHIADLCTPCHVGGKIDFRKAGFRSLKSLHRKLERDIEKLSSVMALSMSKPVSIDFSDEYFWSIAKNTYKERFMCLSDVYSTENEDELLKIVSQTFSEAVVHTRNTWHTVLSSTGMTSRKWSSEAI